MGVLTALSLDPKSFISCHPWRCYWDEFYTLCDSSRMFLLKSLFVVYWVHSYLDSYGFYGKYKYYGMVAYSEVEVK